MVLVGGDVAALKSVQYCGNFCVIGLAELKSFNGPPVLFYADSIPLLLFARCFFVPSRPRPPAARISTDEQCRPGPMIELVCRQVRVRPQRPHAKPLRHTTGAAQGCLRTLLPPRPSQPPHPIPLLPLPLRGQASCRTEACCDISSHAGRALRDVMRETHTAHHLRPAGHT